MRCCRCGANFRFWPGSCSKCHEEMHFELRALQTRNVDLEARNGQLKARIAVLERQRDEYGEWLQAAYDDNGCDCLSLYFAHNQFETVFPEIAEETPNG